MNYRDLKPKQRQFVDLLPVCKWNATEAAIQCGYSKNTASQQASRLLSDVNVMNAIAERQQQLTDEALVDQKEIIRKLKKIVDFNIKDIADWDVKPIKTGTKVEDDGEVKELYDYKPVVTLRDSADVDGDVIREISLTSKGTLYVKSYDKIEAMQELAKHFGWHKNDLNVNLNGKIDYTNMTDEELDKEEQKLNDLLED